MNRDFGQPFGKDNFSVKKFMNGKTNTRTKYTHDILIMKLIKDYIVLDSKY